MRLKMSYPWIAVIILFVPPLSAFGQDGPQPPPSDRKNLTPEEIRLLKEANDLTVLAIKLQGGVR